jgi:hypothetical protein
VLAEDRNTVMTERDISADEGRLPVERFLETHGGWPALPDPSS